MDSPKKYVLRIQALNTVHSFQMQSQEEANGKVELIQKTWADGGKAITFEKVDGSKVVIFVAAVALAWVDVYDPETDQNELVRMHHRQMRRDDQGENWRDE